MWSETCKFEDYVRDGKLILYLGICHTDLGKGLRALRESSRNVHTSQDIASLCRNYQLKNKALGEEKFKMFDFKNWADNIRIFNIWPFSTVPLAYNGLLTILTF